MLNNQNILDKINGDVLDHINNKLPGDEEAKNSDDKGVKYIIDLHKLIDEEFEGKWGTIIETVYTKANETFKSEIIKRLEPIRKSI